VNSDHPAAAWPHGAVLINRVGECRPGHRRAAPAPSLIECKATPLVDARDLNRIPYVLRRSTAWPQGRRRPSRVRRGQYRGIPLGAPTASLGPVEALRLVADDALVDEVELGVRAGSRYGPRVENLVAGLKQRGVRADRPDHARGIPPEDLPFTGFRRGGAPPHLVVDGVDRDRLDLDEQVAAGRGRLRQFDVDQGRLVAMGPGFW